MNPDAKAPEVEERVAPVPNETEQVVKTRLDRSQMADFAKVTGTAMALARSMDDALVILKDAQDVGTRQYMRTGIDNAVRALMAQDRTYAMRLRASAQRRGVLQKDLVPAQPRVTPEIVVLCGSTRFSQEMMEKAAELELEGKIVLSWRVVAQRDSKSHNVKLSVPGHEDEAKHKEMVELHKRKIEIADTVYVVNPKKARDKKGYIGESTAEEILYAKALNKPVYSIEPFLVDDLLEIVNNAKVS